MSVICLKYDFKCCKEPNNRSDQTGKTSKKTALRKFSFQYSVSQIVNIPYQFLSHPLALPLNFESLRKCTKISAVNILFHVKKILEKTKLNYTWQRCKPHSFTKTALDLFIAVKIKNFAHYNQRNILYYKQIYELLLLVTNVLRCT